MCSTENAQKGSSLQKTFIGKSQIDECCLQNFRLRFTRKLRYIKLNFRYGVLFAMSITEHIHSTHALNITFTINTENPLMLLELPQTG